MEKEYRLQNGIKSILDCQCVSEEVLAGFIPDYFNDMVEQLDLFSDLFNKAA